MSLVEPCALGQSLVAVPSPRGRTHGLQCGTAGWRPIAPLQRPSPTPHSDATTSPRVAAPAHVNLQLPTHPANFQYTGSPTMMFSGNVSDNAIGTYTPARASGNAIRSAAGAAM